MTLSNQHRVLYLSHANQELYDMIRAALRPGFELITLDTPDEAERLAKLAEADAVICASEKFTSARVAAAKKLKIAHHQGVGFHDTVAWRDLAARGIPLAITPGGTAIGVSEHALLLMLAGMKHLAWPDSETRAGRWHINTIRHTTYQLHGKTVGIVGIGRIGSAVAALLKPFDVKIYYHDLITLPDAQAKALGVTKAPLEHLLAESDIVTVHVPLTPRTRDLIDAKALARMKRTALLVNTSRGGIVNEEALVAALKSGRLNGAALDVFEHEPPGKHHPIFALPNVIVTPHVSAGTRDAFVTKLGFVFQNLEAFFDGRPIENQVDYAEEMAAQEMAAKPK
jgi:phosphoglycerate dehydrogenase-like enzyme